MKGQMIEEILPVFNVVVRLSIPPGRKVNRVYSALDGHDLAYEVAEGVVITTVPRADLHHMVAVEWQ